MYKIFIIFFGFLLLASCENSQKTTSTLTEKPSTENHQIENITEKTHIEIYPFAEIEVENPNEIQGVHAEFRTSIFTKSSHQNFQASKEIQETNEKNNIFLRSHKNEILKQFPHFQDNPDTDITKENISIQHSTRFWILNNIYDVLGSENIINTEKTKLTLWFAQNFNHTYTGSLWDLPLASLYCDYCFEAGQIIDTVIFASQPEWMPDNLIRISKTTHGENNSLSIAPIQTLDNTYTTIPDEFHYYFNKRSMKDIFYILDNYPNPRNSLSLIFNLPDSYKITDIFYENENEKISVKHFLDGNFLELTKIPEMMKNKSGKIIVNISEK